MTKTTYLATVGIYEIHRVGTDYALRAKNGETIGTFPTARAATDHGVALIAKAYRR